MLCRVKILVLITRTRVTFLAILEFTRDFFELRVETLEYLRVFSSIFHFPKQTNFDGGDWYACAYVHLAQFQKHAILACSTDSPAPARKVTSNGNIRLQVKTKGIGVDL